MTLEEMIAIREERGYSFRLLSEYSGVPVVTLQKVFSGVTKAPRKATLEAIERVLGSAEDLYAGKAYTYAMEADKNTRDRMAKESSAAYNICKRQGEYTIEDYRALPDDRRVELIDGVIYDMPAPAVIHQEIASLMHFAFLSYIRSHKKRCKALESPLDVQLCCDDRTMVQPDLAVICDREKIRGFGIMGAPDFLLEILSPATRKKDMTLKLSKYTEAGVREYWIIDPDKEILIRYHLEDPEFLPEVMTLTGRAGVYISDGELEIDLDEIAEAIREFREL